MYLLFDQVILPKTLFLSFMFFYKLVFEAFEDDKKFLGTILLSLLISWLFSLILNKSGDFFK